MNNLLIKCPTCGTVYRIVEADKVALKLTTDFGDILNMDPETYDAICMKCNTIIDLLSNSMVTESWIADLLFKIKG